MLRLRAVADTVTASAIVALRSEGYAGRRYPEEAV